MSRIGEGINILLEDGISKFSKEVQRHIRRSFGGALSCSGVLGTNVFTKEWDILIILDTCRVDAIKHVEDEYDFLSDIRAITSVGATSAEWMAATFRQEFTNIIKNTAYLANNGFIFKVFYEESEYSLPEPFLYNWEVVDESGFGKLEHIWKYEKGNDEKKIGHREGPTPPEYVTDRGIAVARHYNFDRLILHYNKPHSPYTINALKENRALGDFESSPFEYLEDGGDRKKVYDSYIDNLRYVLDSVEILLNNTDAERVVISADHGEVFGEYFTYGHPFGSLNPYARRVPWIVTSAVDQGEYTPRFDDIDSAGEDEQERDVNEVLKNLGYM